MFVFLPQCCFQLIVLNINLWSLPFVPQVGGRDHGFSGSTKLEITIPKPQQPAMYGINWLHFKSIFFNQIRLFLLSLQENVKYGLRFSKVSCYLESQKAYEACSLWGLLHGGNQSGWSILLAANWFWRPPGCPCVILQCTAETCSNRFGFNQASKQCLKISTLFRSTSTMAQKNHFSKTHVLNILNTYKPEKAETHKPFPSAYGYTLALQYDTNIKRSIGRIILSHLFHKNLSLICNIFWLINNRAASLSNLSHIIYSWRKMRIA